MTNYRYRVTSAGRLAGPWRETREEARRDAIDGDTLRCLDGTRLRIAGIEANEMRRPGCHLTACPTMSGVEARERMQTIVGRQNLAYQPVGKTWNRISAIVTLPDGRDLSCEAIRAGVAVRWDRYWPKGRVCR